MGQVFNPILRNSNHILNSNTEFSLQINAGFHCNDHSGLCLLSVALLKARPLMDLHTDAVAGADVVYTDVWVSMGEPVEVWEERINALSPYQVNAELMAKAKGTAVFMHCLPAYHDHKTAVGREMGEKFDRDAMEVTDEVFNGPQSIVFREAENRMHTIKAVMAATLGA